MTDPPASEVTIHGIAGGGDGVGRWPDGRAVFVPRTAVGDRALVQLVRERSRYLHGELVSLLEPGPDRVDPPCPHYQADRCGGCQLQHLGPDGQLAAKRTIVGDALRRIAHLEADDPAIQRAETPWRYRSKITLTRAGPGAFGFHRYGAEGDIFPLRTCHVAAAEVDALWQAIRERPDLLPAEAGRLMLRIDNSGGLHVSVSLDRGRRWETAERCARFLSERGTAASLWVGGGRGRAGQVAGPPAAVGADVFEQVNPAAARGVRQAAIEALGPVSGDHVWDLYAGTGESSVDLVRAGARVSAVEVDRVAHRSAVRAAEIRRFVGTVEGVTPSLEAPDLVLANPPRRGLGPGVADTLRAAAPRRIVYVSCDPGTLARDIGRLADAYRLAAVTAFDLFPQTAHVECVAVLERQ